MSMTKIEQLIDDLRHERYRWTPVRRTYIAKKNGKLRGLGLPTWSDKLLQEVIRLISVNLSKHISRKEKVLPTASQAS